MFPPHCGLSIIFKTAPNTKLASDKPLDLQQQTAGGSTSICRRSCFSFLIHHPPVRPSCSSASSAVSFGLVQTSAVFSIFIFFYLFQPDCTHGRVCKSFHFTCTSLASRSRSYFKGKVFLSASLTFHMNVRNPQLDSILFTFFHKMSVKC